ncbi:MAG: hypothetical protein ACLPQS_08930 [Acidimicrobiales bacterium]
MSHRVDGRPVDSGTDPAVAPDSDEAASLSGTLPRPRSWLVSVTAEDRWLLALGTLIAIVVCYPFFGGWLQLLDWVRGPRSPTVPPAIYGLRGGLTGGVPFSLVSNLLIHLIGSAGTWLPVALVFPLGAVAIGRLVGGPIVGRIAAMLLYLLNPFVFERLYAGQVAFLLGYALLPFAVAALRRASTGEGALAAGIWAAVLVALSAHYAWIIALPALAFVATAERRVKALLSIATAAVVALCLSAYAVVGPLIAHAQPSGSSSQLSSYATSGDMRYGLFVNVLGMYGFWRPGPSEPKNLLPGWPLFLVALLIVVAYGAWLAWRSTQQRRCALALGVSAVAGYFLALGAQGPTGPVYRWSIAHVPGFVVMREPEKFLVVVVIFYAWSLGMAAAHFAAAAADKRNELALAALVVLLPVLYTPSLVDGLDGQVSASQVPSSWNEVAKLLGNAPAIFLPWETYASVPFANNRTITSPARAWLPNSVLTAAEPGSGYSFESPTAMDDVIARLSADGYSTRHAGAVLATLGVRYVILAKIGDWQAYGWLDHQSDLRPVLSRGGLEVWQNTSTVRPVQLLGALVTVSSEIGYLTDPDHGSGTGVVIRAGRSVVIHAVPVRHRGRPAKAGTASSGGGSLATQQSPVTWVIHRSAPGFVELPIAYQQGWLFNGKPVIRMAAGNLAVRSSGAGGTLSFEPWGGIELSYTASVVALVAVLGAVWLRRRAGRRGAHRPA